MAACAVAATDVAGGGAGVWGVGVMSALGALETETVAMLDGRPPIAPGRVPGGGKGRGFAVTADAAVDGAAAGAVADGALVAAAVAGGAVATGASAGGCRGAIEAVWIAPGRTSTVCTGTG